MVKHDEIIEYQNEQLEIKMNANNYYLEENFSSIKAFLQEMNKKTQINKVFEELLQEEILIVNMMMKLNETRFDSKEMESHKCLSSKEGNKRRVELNEKWT